MLSDMSLKRLETWRETNSPPWPLIGRIIFNLFLHMKTQSLFAILIGGITCVKHSKLL